LRPLRLERISFWSGLAVFVCINLIVNLIFPNNTTLVATGEPYSLTLLPLFFGGE